MLFVLLIIKPYSVDVSESVTKPILLSSYPLIHIYVHGK